MDNTNNRSNKIPHIIHFFWFGGANKPDSVMKCIASWEKFCPDFEIREWNEDNYDIHKHPFMEKAYTDKKWAFVSDYARLDVLYQFGGIYLDTDVEVLKDLSPLCVHAGYFGFEANDKVADGLGFGFSAGHPVLKEMMDSYDGLDEYIESPRLRTEVLIRHGLKLDGSMQELEDIYVYPSDYFSPKDYRTGRTVITENTFSIHHYDSSWKGKSAKKYTVLMRILGRIFGAERGVVIFGKIMSAKDKIKQIIGLQSKEF